MPNFQNVSSGIFKLFAGTTGAVGTSPSGNTSPFTETDYTWDVGFTHQFTPHLAFAQDNYFRIDRHYLDEGQFGFVPIDAPFNYVRGYGGGTEHSLTYNLAGLRAARQRVRGARRGPRRRDRPVQLSRQRRSPISITTTSCSTIRRWSARRLEPLIAGEDYQFTFDGLFSSGLRGGFANEEQLPKVWQFNLSEARDFDVPGLGTMTNRIILLNIFDRTNLIRPATGIGVFQSAYGPRITVYDALTVPLPSL